LSLAIVGLDPGPTRSAAALCLPLPGARVAFVRAELLASDASVLLAWLRAAGGPGEVRVVHEKVNRLFARRDITRAALVSRANHLIRTADAGAAFVAAARADGYDVLELPASVIRKQLTGYAAPSDATIKAALAPRVVGMPVRSNNHQRDAISACVVGAMAPRRLFL
jgi:hypothetical protein